jgi:hypothetical protein
VLAVTTYEWLKGGHVLLGEVCFPPLSPVPLGSGLVEDGGWSHDLAWIQALAR